MQERSRPFHLSWVLSAVILAGITFTVMWPCVQNGFVNFDDPYTVIDNPLVRNPSLASVKAIFTERLLWQYHPVTQLSYMLENAVAGLNPHVFHFDNLLLHVLNTVLVLLFICLLDGDMKIAWATALLFGIHPMNVEPVAWITSRKDLLFVFFYLNTLVCYLWAYERPSLQRPLHRIALLFFVLALLSKEMAVTLPLVLLMIDHWKTGRVTKENVMGKWLYFAAAIAFGYLTYLAAQHREVFPGTEQFSLWGRGVMSGYALAIYFVKGLLPLDLSCFHPLPPEGSILPLLLSMTFVVMVGISFLHFRREPVVVFGILFFLLTVWPALHLVVVNDTVINERYVYLPMIGFFLILAKLIDHSWTHPSEGTRRFLRVFLISYLAILAVISYNRCQVWKDSETLWKNVIQTYPQASIAYFNLGSHYASTDQLDLALEYFRKAADRSPRDPQVYYNMGNVFAAQKKRVRAINAYTDAITLDPAYGDAYINRANQFFYNGAVDSALRDYTRAVELDPESILAYANRAALFEYLAEYDRALDDYERILMLSPRGLTEASVQETVEKKINTMAGRLPAQGR